MNKLFGGTVIPISTIDYSGQSASVVFFNKCSFKCIYCSNHKLINGMIKVYNINKIKTQILDAKPFINALVISGGEPTEQPKELEDLCKYAKSLKLLVGIETNGYYPEILNQLIQKNLIDKLFIDVKAPLNKPETYCKITGGITDASFNVNKSIHLNIPIEIRTTLFRSMNNIEDIAKSIDIQNFTFIVQQGIPENAPKESVRNETILTRNELFKMARELIFLKDVRIRSKEKGEEIIYE